MENYTLIRIWYTSLRNLEIKWVKMIEDIEDLNITINKSNIISIYTIQHKLLKNTYYF